MADIPSFDPVEAPVTETPSTPEKKESPVSLLFDYLEILVFSVCAVLILFTLCGRLCKVNGSSMRNTLYNGEMLITTNLVTPEAGDIIVFHQTSEVYTNLNEPLVKRIIATEGQTVDIDFEEGIVIVDGKDLAEDYALEPTWLEEGMEFPLTVPENSYFLLGDNRNNSEDSRSTDLGTVTHEEVVGKAVLLVLPGETARSGKRDFGRMGLL